MATKGRLVFDGDNLYTKKEARIYKLENGVESAIDSIPGVVDNLMSTSTTDALSANMGRELREMVDSLTGIGKFLSTWDATTGLPDTNPQTDPYTYSAGDYYIVSTVGATNYKPHGGTYTQGVPSTTVETGSLAINDKYYFDGADWVWVPDTAPLITIDSQLSLTSTNPVENGVITNALSGKQDTIADLSTIRSGAGAGATALQPGDNITELVNNANYITAGYVSWGNISGTLSNQTDLQDALDDKQDKLTAGTGITIDASNVISSTGGGGVWGQITGTLTDQTDLKNALDGKQKKLTAGSNISISNNGTISATDTKYTAGTGISIDANNVISATGGGGGGGVWGQITGTLSNQTDLQNALNGKQNTLTAGTGISIDSNNVISATGGGGGSGDVVGPSSATDGNLAAYDGATGKLIKDSGVATTDINTKTFYLSSTSDLTTAQAAYDWCASGKNAIIVYDGGAYVLNYFGGSYIYFYMSGIGAQSSTSISALAKRYVRINATNGSVTGVVAGYDNAANVLLTDYDYSTPYTPTYDGSPATKKYVDDNINTKTFYLSGREDTEAHRTECQPIVDWHFSGKMPIVRCGDMEYVFREQNGANTINFESTRSVTEVKDNKYTKIIEDDFTIYFDVSTHEVTHLYHPYISFNNGVKVLEIGQNYSSPYTPEYDGSPATKKYVDDSVNTKTFYLSSTSDLTNAQAAYDWLSAGKNPVIDFQGTIYTYWGSGMGNMSIGFRSSKVDRDVGVSKTDIVIDFVVIYANSGGEVTSITAGTRESIGGFLDTATDYQTPYTPLYAGSPATKKYVDDSVNTKTFTLPSDLTSQAAIDVAQDAYDWYLAGKTPIIRRVNDDDIYVCVGKNQSGLLSPISYWLEFHNVRVADGTVEGSQYHMPSSVVDTVIRFTYDDSTDEVTQVERIYFQESFLPTSSSTLVQYTPYNDWDPTTKEYVDDRDTYIGSSAPTSNLVEGRLRYDTTNDVLKAYDGTNWNATGTTYTAGDHIEISNANVISTTGLQEELTAGDNISIEDVCTTESDMKGPAPSGFHIPLQTEWVNLSGVLTTTFSLDNNGVTRGTYLKMPMAGARSYQYSTNVSFVGNAGRYWFSNPYGNASNTNSGNLMFSASSSDARNPGFRANGYSVRCFKNTPVIPDGSWTTLYDGSAIATDAGIFWSATEELISISGDGTTWYTIMDKNLGATIVYNYGDAASDQNCGYFYQWGNNYGFPHSGSVTASHTQIDTTGYGPGNYYSSSTYIGYDGSQGPENWSSVNNRNLWGGNTQSTRQDCKLTISATGTTYTAGSGIDITGTTISNTQPGATVNSAAPSTPSEGDLWYDTTNDVLKVYDGTNWNVVNSNELLGGPNVRVSSTSVSDMRGPCPLGFHVPLTDERRDLFTIFSTFNIANTAASRTTYFKLPGAGSLNYENGSRISSGEGHYWESGWNGRGSHAMVFWFGGSLDPTTNLNESFSHGNSIRPFKDTSVIPDNSWTVLYDGSSMATGTSVYDPGIYHNSTLGLISASQDGEVWITMADKNLGAIVVYNSGDTCTRANCGYFYQWGNNYGFPYLGATKTSSTTVDTSGYGPGNYYNSDTFVTMAYPGYKWFSPDNSNLWGGTTRSNRSGNVFSEEGQYSSLPILDSTNSPVANIGQMFYDIATDKVIVRTATGRKTLKFE